MADNGLTDVEILSLDYNGKIMLLERVAQAILDLQIEFAKVSGRHAELRAQMEVLKQVKSALQSALKAEGM